MVDLQEKTIDMLQEEVWKLHWKLRKAEDALMLLKAMHHEGGIDDIVERDDQTYFTVCSALEELQ